MGFDVNETAIALEGHISKPYSGSIQVMKRERGWEGKGGEEMCGGSKSNYITLGESNDRKRHKRLRRATQESGGDLPTHFHARGHPGPSPYLRGTLRGRKR